MTHYLFNPHVFEVIGILGFGIYVLNYGMLSLGILSGNTLTYFVLNLVAASCVMVGLSSSFNLASALIQGFWIVMSIIAILVRLARIERQARHSRRIDKKPWPAVS